MSPDDRSQWPPGPILELLPAAPASQETPPPQPEAPPPSRWGLAVALFGAVLFTTTALSPWFLAWSRTDMSISEFFVLGVPVLTPGVVARLFEDPSWLRLGLSFSLPALLILLAHELGHYLACRFYRMPVTPPFFLPFPAMFGTLGAFIRIRAPIDGKKELFDVGIAGPLAGFVALIPFLLYGVAHSRPAPLVLGPASSLFVPGHCLAVELATRLFHGPLPPGWTLDLHPFAFAAWFGLLVTAINLIPLGQLDGGHILYAVSPGWQRRLALPLWIALLVLGVFQQGWLLWGVIIFLMGVYHPPVRHERLPLDRKRRGLAAVALAIFVLSFMPAGADVRIGPVPAPTAPRSASPGLR